ncbi:MAG: Hpt domain-containing protein [Bacteroidota bacterium]|jgi:HPt (histidine-containing phosphotransfer) domain-containing protein
MKLETQKIKSFLECDDSFLVQLLDSYHTESSECIQLMKTSAETKNWKKVRGAAHKMLGSCQIFLVPDIVNLLKSIEINSENETNTEDIIKDIHLLMAMQDTFIKLAIEYKNAVKL